MRNIFTKVLYHLEKGENLVLVTIVSDSGSTPRGKGSMMLVGPDGYITGSIGGGAVEDAAMKIAANCLRDGSCKLKEFDLSQRSHELGMACGGEVTVYFQFMDQQEGQWRRLAESVLKILSSGRSASLQMDTRKKEMILTEAESCKPGFADGVAIIPFDAEERVIVFGGGHIALELVPILKACSFHVVVMDNREDYVTAQRFPQADELIFGDYTRVSDCLALTEEDYAVIMTSGHSHDFEIQEQILRKPLSYVGVVGSKKKTAAVNAKLQECGLTEEMTSQVHTPIGLDIKAVTPAEIAVSIAAEMILERARKRAARGIQRENGCPMK